MENCLQSFYCSCKDCEEKINGISDGNSDLIRGACSLERNHLHEDRINLCVAFNLFREYIAIDNDVSSYVEEQCQILADFYDTDNEVHTEDDVEDYDDADNRSDS